MRESDTPPARGQWLNTLGFFISSLFAFIGGHVMNYSVILYSQDVLGSTSLAGFAFFLCFFPPLLLGLYAGVLCDRYSTKWLIAAAQAVFMLSAVCLLVLGLQEWRGARGQAMVLLSGLLNGVAWSFIAPARLASLGRLVAPQQLAPTSVLFNLVVMVGFGAAPVCIGLSTQAYGWNATFLLALSLFIAAQLSLPWVRMWWRPADQATRLMQAFREGVDYLVGQPLLWQLLGVALIAFLSMGPIQVVWPRFAREALGLDDASRGLYLGTLALALILGGLLAGGLRTRVPNGRGVFAGVMLIGLVLAMMPWSTDRRLALALILAAGSVAGISVSFIVAALQTRSALKMRGRVMSFYTIVSQVGPATAGLVCGLLADGLGASLALAISGLGITSLAMLAAWRMRQLAAYRH